MAHALGKCCSIRSITADDYDTVKVNSELRLGASASLKDGTHCGVIYFKDISGFILSSDITLLLPLMWAVI